MLMDVPSKTSPEKLMIPIDGRATLSLLIGEPGCPQQHPHAQRHSTAAPLKLDLHTPTAARTPALAQTHPTTPRKIIVRTAANAA